MVAEEYRKARKMAMIQKRNASAGNYDPYPAILEDMVETKELTGRKYLGVMDIPLSLVAGTVEAGRNNAFSSGFLPLFDETSEFASKWMNLFASQTEEGIRDPIVVVEYMHRFYVQEGSKRVSIMKYLDAPTIAAQVFSISPENDGSPEVRLYYEFLEFYKKTGIWSIVLPKPGDYEKLMKCVGKNRNDSWSEAEKSQLTAIFYRFEKAYRTIVTWPAPEQTGAAFLECLMIFSYDEWKEKTSVEIGKDAVLAKDEINDADAADKVEHITDPAIEEKHGGISRILMLPEKKINAAFIFEGSPRDTEWNYLHELGRRHVAEHFADRISTSVYEGSGNELDYVDIIEKAIEDGNTIIFTTSARMMQSSVKVALSNSNVRIFNCSLYYPYKSVRTYLMRNYEIKFILGVIAGAISEGDVIAYEADYPMYGMIANINAFALGVQMTRPQAKVKLFWSGLEDSSYQEEMRSMPVVSANAVIGSSGRDNHFGLYVQNGSERNTIATVKVDWGKFYERILQFIIDGDWKRTKPKDQRSMNYWWGVSAGVLDIECSDNLPSGIRRLVSVLLEDMKDGSFYPFSGEIVDQSGAVHGEKDEVMMVEDYVTMDWLCSNIDGWIPALDELNDCARELVELQGVMVERGR